MTKVYCEHFDCIYNEDEHCCREYIELTIKLEDETITCDMKKTIKDLLAAQEE